MEILTKMNKYLIVNTGSASKKYAIYEGEKEVAYLHLETEEKKYVSTLRFLGKSEKTQITEKDFNKSLDYLVLILKNKNIISGKADIAGVGIRVVAPGLYFQTNRIVDAKYISNLKQAKKKAPLHLEMIVTEISKLKVFFGNKVKIVGISDSAFHSTMLDNAKNYAISSADAKKHDIYRYGYHGISASSIVNKLEKRGSIPNRMIICHIGGGVSVMAVKDGKSIDTSMGFTPLEGMVMANRVGDIDSGAVVYLSEVLKIKGLKLLEYLNKKSGLLGLSGGMSNDVRDLFTAEEKGNVVAQKALDFYAYKIQKQIGSYFVALGGLDTLVFTGTVGERSYKMRKRICSGLKVLGISIDEHTNECCDGVDCTLNVNESRVHVQVMKTDEMNQIYIETQKILSK